MRTSKKIMGVLLVIVMVLSVFGVSPQNGYASTIAVGVGSYTDVLPAGQVGPQSTIYKTPNLTGGIPTNSWESSILWTQYSEPMYSHPLSVKFSANGLELGTPMKSGEGAGGYTGRFVLWQHRVDMTIKNSNYSSYTDARADKITDWSFDGVLTSGSANVLKATITKGSPYIYFDFPTGNPQIVFPTVPTVFYGNSSSQYLGITINGVSYGLFAPAGATWSGIGTTTLTCNLPSGKTYFSIAVLPDNTTSTLSYFKDRAYAFITNTQVSWSYVPNTSEVTTTFTITTTAKEGSNLDTIICLYPHQWRNNSLSYLPYTYNTVRGLMKTISGTSFTTKYKYYGILPTMPLNGSDSTTLNYLLNSESITISSSDTYWNGKEQNRVSSIVQLAKMNNSTTVLNNAISTLKNNLQDWFTYSGTSDSKYFYYNYTWGTLIGYPPSYGTNDQINDHHFHYGYFINAAAQIALVDKNWAAQSQWGGMVNLLIKDIANWERTDTRFPFLRYFDPYEGHSWASGHANFVDGNNQESFSEAMNSWQAIILWGTVTGQTAIRDLGIYLYTTEAEAMYNYVFDLYNDVIDHSGVYNWHYASLIWGGKYCAEIWWDAGSTANFAAQSRGIELLPMTGGSFYLAKDKNYVQSYYNEMLTQAGTTEPPCWQDIWYMYLALSNPSLALSKWNSSIANETGQSKAFTYVWLNALNTLGVPDMTVTANTPLYQVFNRNGTKTYVVYNSSDSSIIVNFSDGAAVTVAPNTLAVSNGGNNLTNLALNKPATASSIENSNYLASYAFDGNQSTRWSSAFSDPQWIAVDLGTVYTVSRVKLYWEAAYAKSFQIQVSTDNTNWTTVYSTTSGTGGVNDITFTPVNTRYVRMYGTERGTPYGYSLWEFEVYGTTGGSTVYLPQTTWFLFNQTTSGVTPGGENLQTTNSYVTGWQPTATITTTPKYWYSSVINGTYKAGTWQFMLWTNSPGSSSQVKVEMYRVNDDGSNSTLIGSQTIDINTTGTGNHQTVFNITSNVDIIFNNQRIQISIVKVDGVDTTMAYNTNDFPIRLITP
ncbi:MAG TPA: hypothetical protein GXX15_13260 [Clostridia bacterium]|nr:hypothetical protein [Clostridia bacterium]